MKDFKQIEKFLKRYLKKRASITTALIVSFLVTGIPYGEVDARDLRSRVSEANKITPDKDGPSMNKSANKSDVIDIVNPNSNGISHNKFIDFNVGSGNNVIFNNNASSENVVSKTGGLIFKNKNLASEAKTILTEVTGTNSSNINGTIEIAGKKADFILANENGINVNGASFINTNGVTLTTGKVNTNNSNISFEVKKGNINLNGVGTTGKYFNVIAKTIEIHKEVAPLEDNKKANITFVAGENKVTLNNGKIDSIIKEKNIKNDNKYGIYASNLGAMYGNNIKLISTGNGLGVKHEGIILSEKDIEITSDGDIYLTAVNSKGNINLKGQNFTSQNKEININGVNQIGSIFAQGDINLDLKNNIYLNSAIQAENGDIKITAKNLTLLDKTSARIISNKEIIIKLSEKLDVQGVMIPSIKGVNSQELIITLGNNREILVKNIKTGKIYNSSEVTWTTTGIVGKDVNIFTKELSNKGLISAEKRLKIQSDKIINEKNAVLKAGDLTLIANNSFINKGEIRENKKELNEIIDSDGKLNIKVTFGTFENHGNISSKNIQILVQKLLNSLTGKIIATDGNIVITSSAGDLLNYGEIFADKNLSLISSKNIVNTGKIVGDSLSIQALKGEHLNSGNISSIKDLSIVVQSLVNAGSKKDIEKYLKDFYNYSEEELNKVESIIKELNKKISLKKESNKLEVLKESLRYFNDIKQNLLNIKEELSKTGTLGNISGNSIEIKASKLIENKGIINAKSKLNLTGKNIENDGILQGNEGLFLHAVEKILNGGRVISNKNIEIKASSFISNGEQSQLKEYLELLKKFDEKEFEKLTKEIEKLEKTISEEKDKIKIEKIKKEINLLNNKLKDLKTIKSKISSFKDLGIIEGNNIVITTISSLENNGVLISNEDTTLKSNSIISNNGTLSTGKNLKVTGESFNSSNLIVRNNLDINVKEVFTSKNLTVGENIDIKGSLINKGTLSGNKNLEISGEMITDKDSSTSIKQNINVKGGADLKGTLKAKNLFANNTEKDFSNDGNIEINSDLVIKAKNFINNNATIGGKVDISSKDSILNKGNLQVKNDILLKGNSFNNMGKIATEGSFNGEIDDEFISKKLSSKNSITIKSKSFNNKDSIVSEKDISINVDKSLASNSIHSKGEVQLEATDINIKKDIISSKIVIKGDLTTDGSIQSKGEISVESSKNITINSKGKLVAVGDIELKAKKDITNTGMIVSNKNIAANGDSISNKGTIWASNDINLKAQNEIYNSSVIEAKENMELTAKKITNDAGSIKAGKKLNINTNSLVNKSSIVEDIKIVGYKEYETVTRWDDTFNYHLDYVQIQIPEIVDNSYVKDKATISSGGDLVIKGFEQDSKADVLNSSGTLEATGNINIFGNVTNTSHRKEMSVEWFLENIKIKFYWETKLYITNAHGNHGVSFEGTLKDAFYWGHFTKGRDQFYRSLTQNNDPVLNKVLSSFLGPDWKIPEKPKSQDQWNKNATFEFVAANAAGQILAGNNIIHSGGFFNNEGGKKGENQKIKISIGEDSVDGIVSNGEVNIGDLNNIKEVDGVKQIHDVIIQTGEVTLNGVTIKAQTGNTAGSIAVAGTISPIIFIEIPKGENGIFKPATPKPNGIQPMYETNIEFIDPSKYFGSEYFFSQIGYDKNKTGSIIGDAYYEYMLISKMIKEGLGYAGKINSENIKFLLDNALKVQKDLGLEIGKPLTPEQINKLDKDIVWYVEVEVNGQKTLTPQMYFSNSSRVNIANGQGNGGSSTVKAGGNIITDNTGFNNTNGSITADGNIIIKSQGNIDNNSYGNIGGGITSNNGNIALDSEKDINIKGGTVKGDNVLVSGKNINIESTLGTDSNGNQFISDKGSIQGDNGIQLDANNDINIKGGSLNALRTDMNPEKQEENNSPSKEKSSKKDPVKKDVKYYEELFKKDSSEIIQGDAGSINLNAKGNINIEDINVTSSKVKHENNNERYSTDISLKVESKGSEIVGSNVNIKGEKDVNIKGSSLSTNDLLKQNKDKNLKSGSINIEAKNNVNIVDSQDRYYNKSSSKKTSMEKDLLTVKWSEKEKSQSLSKGTSLQTGGNLNISSENNIKIQGSTTNSLGDTNINAKNNIDILDGRNEIKESSSEGRYQVLGGGISTSEKKGSFSQGSNLSSGEDLNLSSGNNIKIINGQLNTTGDTNLKAGNDISIEAGKNEYSEKSTSTNFGIYVEGTAGLGGVGVIGNASTSDMSVQGEISSEWGGSKNIEDNLDGSNEKTPSTSGKPHMDQLVNSEVGFKAEHKQNKIDETTWSESSLNGNNINIEAGNKVDIGGGDYKANKDINIKGKRIDSTKYEDERVETNSGFSVAIKQSQGVSSSIADTINTGLKMDSAIKSGNANTGVLAAQGVGAASNLLFNDMAGVFSKQSVNISFENSKSTEKSENISSLEGEKISIKATEGDITLNGVEIKGKNDISLDANQNINISSAKKSSSESGYKVDLEAQLEESAGFSTLWGGNTDIGIGGSVNIDITKKNSSTNLNSSITSDGNISIKSGKDTNIKGGEIEAKKDASIDVGRNLNIENQKSSYNENSINANAGGNVSIGGSTNTIGKAELGFSAGGGDIWKSGETIEQSGIKSGGKLDVNVKGDLNLIGGVIGSETEEGSLNVEGNLNVKDLVTTKKQGGAHITVSGGFTGDMGVDGSIGDEQDKQITSKGTIGLKSGNISVKGNVTLNGNSSSTDMINKDLSKSQVVDKDSYKQGGDISLSGSTSNIKDVKDKVSSVKDKINSLKKTNSLEGSGSSKKGTDISISNDIKNALNSLDKVIVDTEYNSSEKNLEKALKNQEKISNKAILTPNDKHKASLLEQELKNQVDNIKNEIINKNKDSLLKDIAKKEQELSKKLNELNSLVKKENDIINNSNSKNNEVYLPENNKYDVLDKDNAFDFPANEEKKIEINDKANEKLIITNRYNELKNEAPIYKNPPSYDKNSETLSQKAANLEKKISSLNKDIERMEKVKKITGGDFEFNSSLDGLYKAVEAAKKNVIELDKKSLTGLSDEEKNKIINLSNKLDNLLIQQENIIAKGELTTQDKEDLNKLEVEIKESLDKLYNRKTETPLNEVNLANKKENNDSIYDIYTNKNKYDILDKDNPFDFPKDNVKRAEINDLAGEKIIVPEHYEPLTGVPEKYNSQNSIKGILKNGLTDKIKGLLDEQKKIADKKKINSKDKEKLAIIEQEIKSLIDQLNKKTLIEDKTTEKVDRKLSFNNKIKVRYFDKNSIILNNKKSANPGLNKYLYNGEDSVNENSSSLKENNSNNVDINSKNTLSEFENKLYGILAKQQNLINSPDKYSGGPERLDRNLKKLLDDLSKKIDEDKNLDLSQENREKLETKIKEYKETKDKHFSGEAQKVQELDSDLKIITRSEKDIRQNIKSISNEIDKLPKEHVLDYLNNIFKNSTFNEQRDAMKGEKDILLKNPKLKNDETTEVNLSNIYNGLVKLENDNIRKELDNKLIDSLSKDKTVSKLLSENKLTKENVEILFDHIQEYKKEAYKNVLNEDFKEIPIKVLPPNEDPNILGINNGAEVKVYLNKDANLTDIFETLVHEMIHQDQNTMIDSNNPKTGNLPYIYYLNSTSSGYIGEGNLKYRDQPVEKEAFESSEVIVKAVLDDISKNNIDSDLDKSSSDDEESFVAFIKSSFKKNSNDNTLGINKYNYKKDSSSSSTNKNLEILNNNKAASNEVTLQNKDRNELREEFNTNDDIWEGIIEEKITSLLEKQKNLSDKNKLSSKDKKELNKIEDDLKGLLEISSELNATKKENEITIFDKKKFKEKTKGKESKQKIDNNTLTRSSKDIKKNLELVAKNANKIPAEHLNNYLGDLLMNSNNKELLKKNKIEENKLVIKNPMLDHNKKSANNLGTIYKAIYDQELSSTRKELNDDFLARLQNDSEIKRLIAENNPTSENIKKLAEIVGNLKKHSFETILKKDYDKANLVIKGDHPTDNGGLMGNTLTLYTNPTRSIIDYLGTIVHEYTHNDQRNIRNEKQTNDSLLPYLYAVNSSKNGYIDPTTSIEGYKNQPLEREAYELQKEVLKNLKKENTSNLKYDILAKDNAFDFPQDDWIRVDITDKANEKKIVPEYYKPLEGNPEILNSSKKEIVLQNLLKKQDELSRKSNLNDIEKSLLNELEKEIKDILADMNEKKRENLYQEKFDINNYAEINFKEFESDYTEPIDSIKKSSLEEHIYTEVYGEPIYATVNKKNKKTLTKESQPAPKAEERILLNNDYKLIKRSEEDIRKNLKTVTEYSEKIPTEHLTNYLENITKNSESLEIVKKMKEPSQTGNKNVILMNPLLDNNILTERNLGKLYSKIYNNQDTSFREKMNNDLFEKIISNPQLMELLEQKIVSKDDIKYMIQAVKKYKEDIFKNTFNKDLGTIKFTVKDFNGVDDGGYKNGEINLYVGKNDTPISILKTLVHELTHAEQEKIIDEVDFHSDELKKLYDINFSDNGYLEKEYGIYVEQPIEKEAHDAENLIATKLKKEINIKRQNILRELKKDSENIKLALTDMNMFKKKQEELLKNKKFYGEEAVELEEEYNNFKKDVENALIDYSAKYKNISFDKLESNDKKLLQTLEKEMELFEKNRDLFFSGAQEKRDGNLIIRSEKDIRQNLASVARYKNNIPQNHLMKYLEKNLLTHKEIDSNKAKSNGILLKNPTLTNNILTEKNILALYNKLLENESFPIRKELNAKFIKRLIENKEINELMEKQKLTKDEIIKLAELLKSLKINTYKEVIGEDSLDFSIEFKNTDDSSLQNGAGMLKGKLLIFFDPNNVSSDFILETLIHEMVHNDQFSIINSKNPNLENLKRIYKLNMSKNGYLEKDAYTYLNQPIEKEAIKTQKEMMLNYKK